MLPGLNISVTSTGIFEAQDPFALIYVNAAFEALTGFTAADVLGRPHPLGDTGDIALKVALRHAVATGETVTTVLRLRRADGATLLGEVTLRPLRDDAGTVTHVLAFTQDVTRQQRLETALTRLPDWFMTFDHEWTTTFVNAAAAATAGRPAAALIGQRLLDAYPTVATSAAFHAARETLETGVSRELTTYSETLGRVLHTSTYATDDGVAVLLRDVTFEQQALLDLQTSQGRFSKVFHASPLPIIITRRDDGLFIDANPAFLQLTGYDLADLAGMTSLDLWADPADRADLIRLVESGQPIVDQRVAYRVKSGQISTATIAVMPVTLDRERCLVTMLRDISEELMAQHRLELSERVARQAAEDLQRTLDLSLDLITTLDDQGRFVSVNAASERLLGYPPEDMIGRSYLDFVHPDDLERSAEGSRRLRMERQLTTFQNRYVRRDGRSVWFEWTSVRLPDGMTYAIARDVTARRAATEDLAFLAAIVRASTDAIIGLDLHGTVRSWNAGAERMYGFSAAEIIGHKITEIVPPDLLDQERDLLARAAQGQYTPAIETTRVSRSGALVPVQLSIAPIFDSSGAVIGVSKIAQDISVRHASERQILTLNAQLQRQLERVVALREIDQAITSSLDLTVTLGLVLDHVRQQVNADAVTVLLLDPQALTLMYAGTRGFTPPEPHGHTVGLDHGPAGRAVRTRQPVLLGDLPAQPFAPEWQERLGSLGLTAYAAVPLIAKGRVLGVIEVFRREAFEDPDWLDVLQTLAAQAAIAVDSAQLVLDLERGNFELGMAYQETIEGWARALDLRDRETEGHSRRVTDMTVELCRALGVPPAELVHVRRGALLHDIGKMGIADAILLKPGPLTDDEWTVMRRHPGYAVELLSPIQFLRPALDIPRYHHEKWDGSGYPNGLSGAAIPLTARAFAVVDVYDALTNDRPYRPAWTRDRALAHIQAQAGTHFDPAVVQAFLTVMENRPPDPDARA